MVNTKKCNNCMETIKIMNRDEQIVELDIHSNYNNKIDIACDIM